MQAVAVERISETLQRGTGDKVRTQPSKKVVVRFTNTVIEETSLSSDMPMTATCADWLPTGARFVLAPAAQVVRDAQVFMQAASMLAGTAEDDAIVHNYVMSRKPRVEPKPLTRKAAR